MRHAVHPFEPAGRDKLGIGVPLARPAKLTFASKVRNGWKADTGSLAVRSGLQIGIESVSFVRGEV
jgi:hypothetical protein